jgi:hypothetical protein
MSQENRYVIGIPTVARRRGYLAETVASILSAMNAGDLKRTRIVIFNGDSSPDNNADIHAISTRYAELCASGILRIESRRQQLVLEDCDERTLWWRKQTLDGAALLEHCQRWGDYYLHLEDDIVASAGFLDVIDSKLQAHRAQGARWAILSFYNSFPVSDGAHYSEFRLTRKYFGFIGQLFQVKDIPLLCRYFRANYADAPIDVLVARWVLSEGRAVIGHSPSQFQHVGVISSFQGRIQLWDSPQFDDDPKTFRARMRVALRDLRLNHPDTAQLFLDYRRQLRQIQKLRGQSLPAPRENNGDVRSSLNAGFHRLK